MVFPFRGEQFFFDSKLNKPRSTRKQRIQCWFIIMILAESSMRHDQGPSYGKTDGSIQWSNGIEHWLFQGPRELFCLVLGGSKGESRGRVEPFHLWEKNNEYILIYVLHLLSLFDDSLCVCLVYMVWMHACMFIDDVTKFWEGFG